jgi:hypothetical protein
MMPEVDRKIDTQDPKDVKSGSVKSGAQPVADNPQQRLKWIAHLEFAQSDGVKKGIVHLKSSILRYINVFVFVSISYGKF